MPLYVWCYCFLMWLFEDAFKVLTIYTLKRYNIFGKRCSFSLFLNPARGVIASV